MTARVGPEVGRTHRTSHEAGATAGRERGPLDCHERAKEVGKQSSTRTSGQREQRPGSTLLEPVPGENTNLKPSTFRRGCPLRPTEKSVRKVDEGPSAAK